jgi:hypothetical protein
MLALQTRLRQRFEARAPAAALALALGAGSALLGCSGVSPAGGGAPAAQLPALGPRLDALWRAHGGLAAWSRWHSARLRLRAEGDGGLVESWPQELRFALRDWSAVLYGRPGAERSGGSGAPEVVDLAAPPQAGDGDALDFHLRTARFLLFLPFALIQPEWRACQDVHFARRTGTPNGFWAICEGLASPHSDYFMVVDPETGLLKTVYYQIRHPYLCGNTYAVDYRAYRRIGGLVVATELAHRLVRDASGSGVARSVRPVDPFEAAEARFDTTSGGAALASSSNVPLRWTLHIEELALQEAPADAGAPPFEPPQASRNGE